MCTFPERRRLAVVAITTCLALAGSALVHGHSGPSGKWWQSETFQRDLSLAPEQVRRIEEVFQSIRPTLQANKKELDQREQELSRTITEGTASEPDVLRFIDRVEASRSALGRTRALMLYRIYRVLTPEQRSRLQAIHQDNRDRGKGDKRKNQE